MQHLRATFDNGFRLLLAMLLSTLLSAHVASAGPWADPGDARLRTDVELLKAYGYIIGPVDAWPLPWAQIDAGIARAQAGGPLPPHMVAAVRRISILSAHHSSKSRFLVRVAGTNEPALVRSFGRVARNTGDVTVAAAHDLGRLSVTWGGSWQSDGTDGQEATRHGNGFSPDPSHATLRLGDNWALYGGWMDVWWGAGQDGAMLFSTSARPFPKVGLRRLQPYSIDLPVLRWLGPVTFDMFVGMATEKRDHDNPAIVGMRLAFQPTPWFEIALNRGMMLCGSGRPCNAGIWGRALLGVGDFDNTGTENEPGNQLAGFDFSYKRPIGSTGQILKLHFATTAEDADNILIEQFARQAGAGISGPVGARGALFDGGIEYLDSQAQTFFGDFIHIDVLKRVRGPFPGSTYNNFLYPDGWTYGRRPLGHSLDGDARAITIHTSVTDSSNRRWHIAARDIVLNLNNFESYRISRTREHIGMFEGGVDWPTRLGDLRAQLRYQSDRPNTPDSSRGQLQAEIGWTSRF